MDRADVEERLDVALKALQLNDRLLLEYDLSERTLCGRLAMYLQGVFPAHHVDVEYNRHGIDPKRLPDLEECQAEGDALVYPDIVVHHRGNDASNVLAIEVKKSTNTTSRECDRAKLSGFIGDLYYDFAVLVDLPVKDDAGDAPSFEWLVGDHRRRAVP